MIYIDSSVALARLLFESRSPSERFWRERLVSSRLLEYEVWNRIHARQLARSWGGEARALLAGVELIEMTELVLARALEPFPIPLGCTSSCDERVSARSGRSVALASYDNRLLAAAQALGISIAAL